MIVYDVCSRGALIAGDQETTRHWLYADRLAGLLRQVQSSSYASTTVQVTTGISADESDLLDLQHRVNHAIRQATLRGQQVRP